MLTLDCFAKVMMDMMPLTFVTAGEEAIIKRIGGRPKQKSTLKASALSWVAVWTL